VFGSESARRVSNENTATITIEKFEVAFLQGNTVSFSHSHLHPRHGIRVTEGISSSSNFGIHVESLDGSQWVWAASLQHAMVRGYVGQIPQQALETAMHRAQDQEEVVEGAQHDSLEGDLHLRLTSPAHVIQPDITNQGKDEEQQLQQQELQKEPPR
jgi:hypothetical protein